MTRRAPRGTLPSPSDPRNPMIKKLLGALLALFAAAAFAAVDANTATQAELEAVKGVGPALSSKIIDERKKAPFKDWQDMITRVKGVGEHNSTKFSAAGLTVNGTAYVAPPAKPSKVQSDAPAQAPKSATKLDTSKPAGAQPQSAEPAEADKAAKKTAAAAPADTKKGAKGAAVDTPQSSAPVTTPAAKALTAEERKAAKEKAKEEKAAKKKAKADAAAAKEGKPAADAASAAK